MKKILTIAVASLAVAAVADFSPQIGVTTLSLNKKNSIIPVQFTSLAGSGNVTADALVCTNNIPLDSYLFVYQDNSYSAWQLRQAGWVGVDISSDIDGIKEAGAGAANTELSVGSAIWLSLNGSTSATVSFYGKVASSTNSTIVAGKCNLLANPTGALVEDVLGKLSGMANGDQIRLVDSHEVIFRINGEWKMQSSETAAVQLVKVDSLSVPAYGGFWYYSKGSSNITINW